MTPSHSPIARRDFLRRTATLGAIAGTPFAGNLSLIGAAAAESATDHKALVCVFLDGGNDQSNTVVPYQGTDYNSYFTARPTLARSQSSLRALTPLGYSGPRLSVPSEWSGLKSLFDQGQCALIANVGTLNQPTTLAQWKARSARFPAGLFSHSDQRGAWQTGVPDRPSQTGWLGRVGDLSAAAHNPNAAVSICVSLAGNNAMQNGLSTIQYQVSTVGPVPLTTFITSAATTRTAQVLQQLLTEPRGHLLQNAYTAVGARSISTNLLLDQALTGAQPITTRFPAGDLSEQLKMVARMLSARSALSQRRQIFFVSVGGFDFHDDLFARQSLRLKEVNDALVAFHAATVEMGISRQVTTFTASEFGRALQSNGRGCDHGWGAHHLVMGGAVAGNRVYGRFPTVALNGPDDAGQGRLLPSTSVDEYAGALARWFGVPASMLSTVLPNLDRFENLSGPGLGFV